MSTSPQTDLKLLKAIYETYHEDFLEYSREDIERDSVIYVPIDIKHLAGKIKMDSQLLFGRIYYDIDKRYRFEQDDGSKVHLFALQVGSDRHTVNFPLLAGVLANLSERNFKFWLPMAFSIAAFLISLIGIAI